MNTITAIPRGARELEKTERRILKLLQGYDIIAIEDMFSRVLREAKRRAKLP